jgi:hypothetical protein
MAASLQGVRDEDELNRLPKAEREKCLAVWAEAEAWLLRAHAEP